MIPGFFNTLDELGKLHRKKNADYSTNGNPFFNFEFTEYIVSKFSTDRDKVFVWPIANKLARLAALLGGGKDPQNESLIDSLHDLAAYIILWKCDLERRLPSRNNIHLHTIRESEDSVRPEE